MTKWRNYLINVLGLAFMAGFALAETPIADTDPLNTVPNGRLLYSPTRAGSPDVVSVSPPTGYEVQADDSTASPEADNPGEMKKGNPWLTATSATWRGREQGFGCAFTLSGIWTKTPPGRGGSGGPDGRSRWKSDYEYANIPHISLTLAPTSIDAGDNGTATVKVINPQDNTSYLITLTSAGPEPITQPVATLTFPDGDTLTLDKLNPSGTKAVNGRTVGYATLVATSTNVQTPPATRPARVEGPDLTVTDMIWPGTSSSKSDTNDDPADPIAALAAGPKTLGTDADQRAKLKMQLGGHKVIGTYTWSVRERSTGTAASTGTFPAPTTAEPSPSAEVQVAPGHQYFVKIDRSTPAPVAADAGYNRQVNVDVPVVDLQGTDYKSRAVAEAKEEEPGVIAPGSIGVASTGISSPSYPRTLSWDHPDKVTVTEIVNGTATVIASPVNLAANDAAKQYTIVPTAAMGVDDSTKMTLKVSAADNHEFRDEVVVKRNPIDIQLADLAEDKEESVGAIVAVNDDDDNDDNRMDKDENDGTKTVENEDDLIPLKISVASTIPAGTKVTLAVALKGGGDWKTRVKLWQDAKRVTEVVEPLEWTKGTSPIPTIYVEGLTVSVNRDVAFTASCVVAEETYTDLALATVGKADLSTPNVPEQDEQKKGQIICLNNDNDDFGSGSTHNYEPDRAQNNVSGENDLQPVTLALNLNGFTEGQVRLELASGDSKVKVWMLSTKGWGNPLLSEASKAYNWTVAEFNALSSKTFYVEGYDRSGSVKDVTIKLSYRKNASDAKPVLEDKIKWTVVQLMLDANNDGAVTDDTSTFDPGYAGGAPVLTAAANWRQGMQLILAPLSVGATVAEISTSTNFSLPEVTSIPGVAMNYGNQTGTDYSFSATGNLGEKELSASAADKVTQEFYCRDFGGRTTIWVSVRRGAQVLTTCELRLPLDTDRDWLPDTVFEDRYRSDPDGNVVFNKENDRTAGGIDRHYDLDARAITPGALAIDRNPSDGRRGDGLTAFEEYRGFIHSDLSNANPAPHRKDLFAASSVQDDGVDMGLALLPTALSDLRVHRLRHNPPAGEEQFRQVSLVVNYNRSLEADAYPPGWAAEQRCLLFSVDNTIGADVFGMATGPAIQTGPNGVCETEARPGDTQRIERWEGLADAVAIRPGPNGIIDPPYDKPNDVLNVAAMQVQMGSDGRLTSLSPEGDDRIRGSVVGGANGHLEPATVTGMDGNDVLRGTISGTAVRSLDPATVASAQSDELVDVVLDPNADGFASSISPSDTQNADGTISPRNPSTGANDGFQSVRAGNDFFRGTIREGANNQLDARPAGSDVVAGSIEEGSDSNLKSRPTGDDYVVGYMDPGPGPNAHFDPKLNDKRTDNSLSGSPLNPRDADDSFDPDRCVITAGADGLRSTSALGDDEPCFEIGRGEPDSVCVTGLRVHAQPNTTVAGTPTGGNDGWIGSAPTPGEPNNSPNEHWFIRINITLFQGFNYPVAGRDGIWGNADDTRTAGSDGILGTADDEGVDLRTVANGGVAANDGPRRSWIGKTMVHEGGHGIHCEHYRPLGSAAGGLAAGAITYSHDASRLFPGRNGAGAPANTDYMRSGIWDPVAPGGQYDAVSVDQIRLHVKHNP